MQLSPKSTTSTCCGYVGQQVVQQAVQRLEMWSFVSFPALRGLLQLVVDLLYNVYNKSTTSGSKWSVGFIDKNVVPIAWLVKAPAVDCM